MSEAINVRLGNVGREGLRIPGKGNVERVVFVQAGLVSAILFYAKNVHWDETTTSSHHAKADTSRSNGRTRSSRRQPAGPAFIVASMPIYSATGTPSTS